MDEETNSASRRVTDKGLLAQGAAGARRATSTLWDWAEKRKVAAHVVMAVAVTLTIRIVEWVLDFPYDAVGTYTGMEVAAIQAAVLGPWGLMQGAMFKFYYDLVKANGNGMVQRT
jgi:hypothetical protein